MCAELSPSCLQSRARCALSLLYQSQVVLQTWKLHQCVEGKFPTEIKLCMHVDKYSCTYLYTYALSFFHLVFCVNFPGVVEYMRTVYGCKVEELELCLPGGKQLRDGGVLCVLAKWYSAATCRSSSHPFEELYFNCLSWQVQNSVSTDQREMRGGWNQPGICPVSGDNTHILSSRFCLHSGNREPDTWIDWVIVLLVLTIHVLHGDYAADCLHPMFYTSPYIGCEFPIPIGPDSSVRCRYSWKSCHPSVVLLQICSKDQHLTFKIKLQ